MTRKIFNSFDETAGLYTARVVGSATLTFDAIADIPDMTREIWDSLPPMGKKLLGHGIGQKLPDTAAALRGPAAYAAMKEVKNNLRSGLWTSRGGVSGHSVIAEAYAEVTGKTPEKAAEALAAMTAAELKNVKSGPLFRRAKIRVEGARLDAEIAAEKAAATAA